MVNTNSKLTLVLFLAAILALPLLLADTCGGETACHCGDSVTSNIILTENLTCGGGNGLLIAVNDTTIDCNGYSITSNTQNYYGIYNSGIGMANLVVKNCYIGGFDDGIYLSSGNNLSVINVNFSSNGNGMGLYSVEGQISLTGVKSYSNAYRGLYYAQGNDDLSVNFTILNSSFFNNSYDGMYIKQNFNGETTDNFKLFLTNVSSYSNSYSGLTFGNAITEINNCRFYNNTLNGINAGTDDDSVFNKLKVSNSNISDNGQDGIFARELQTDASYNLTNNEICGNLGAGGQIDSSCPFIYGYNGKDYQFVNDAFPLAKLWFLEEVPWIVKVLVKFGILNEVPGIRDTSFIKVPFDLQQIDNQYNLKIREEYEEKSYFDKIELMVVDHSPNTEVYPDRYSSNIITTSKSLSAPISCIDNYGNDCLSLISSADNQVQKLKKNDYIIIDLGDLSNKKDIKLIINKGAVGAQNVKKFEVLDEEGNWVEADYKLGNIVNLNGFATTSTAFDISNFFIANQYKIKIFAEDLPFLNREFDERLIIDYIAIDANDYSKDNEFKVTSLKPAFAGYRKTDLARFWSEIKTFENNDNNFNLPDYVIDKNNNPKFTEVTEQLIEDECNFVNVKNCEEQVILTHGDELNVLFDVPEQAEGTERDIIVVTNGAYEKLPSSDHTDIFVGTGYTLTGVNNTCDTTWNYNEAGVSGCTHTCGLTYFAGGNGNSTNPYQIETCQQLQYMTYNLTANYVLNNNVNCSATSSWNYDVGGYDVYRGFAPIGAGHKDNNYAEFTGTLDGNGYNITNLYINRQESYVGLFGILGTNSTVKNLGLINVDITGGDVSETGTGALAAYSVSESTINNTFSTGTITSSGYLGGLVGAHAYDPTTCFLAGTKIILVDGSTKPIELIKVGEVVKSYNEQTGESSPAIVSKTFVHKTNSYLLINNDLKVTSNHPLYINSEWKEAGQIKIGDYLLNENNHQILVTSILTINKEVEVYNFEVQPIGITSQEYCGIGHNYYAEGILAHNKCPRVYTVDNAVNSDSENISGGYVFDSLLSVYHIGKEKDGPFNYTLKYFHSPIIRIDYDPNEINYLDFVKIIVKDTSDEGQVIFEDLLPIACNPTNACNLNLLTEVDQSYLILDEANQQVYLDFGSFPELRSGYEREYIIYSSGYSDIINDFQINDFPKYIQDWLSEYNRFLNQGKHHTIMNSYSSCTVIGEDYAGGLVGRNDGTINSSYATGNVSGDDYIGGLVGLMENGVLINSHAQGTVLGNDDYIGGLVGYTSTSTVSTSYSNNSLVQGDEYIGGLVGYAYGSVINNTYSWSQVIGTQTLIGGLIGKLEAEAPVSVYNSYATGNVSSAPGQGFVGGLVGYSDGDDVQNCFSTGFVNATYGKGGLVGVYSTDGVLLTNGYWYNYSEYGTIDCYAYDTGDGYSYGHNNCSSVNNIAYFYDSANAPLSSWDFSSIWVEQEGNYPYISIRPADTDNDGVSDDTDKLYYNESNVNTSGLSSSLNITIGGNSTSSNYTSGAHVVNFYDGANLLINFTHNFTNSTLDLSKITITKATNSIIVNMSNQLQGNKTIYLTDNSFVSLCVKDAQIASISEVSSACNGANETDFTSCLGGSLTSNGIVCTDLGTTIEIKNLQHSAALGVPASSSSSSSSSSSGGSGGGGSAYCGDGYCNKILEKCAANINENKQYGACYKDCGICTINASKTTVAESKIILEKKSEASLTETSELNADSSNTEEELIAPTSAYVWIGRIVGIIIVGAAIILWYTRPKHKK